KPSGLRRSTPASLFQQRQGHSDLVARANSFVVRSKLREPLCDPLGDRRARAHRLPGRARRAPALAICKIIFALQPRNDLAKRSITRLHARFTIVTDARRPIRDRFGWEAIGYASVVLGISHSIPDEFRELAEKEL